MATITVGPTGRDYTLPQAAINAAAAGDTIVLDSGVTFTQDITLPTTQHATPVVIKSSTAAPSRRVALSDTANMATLMALSVDEPGVVGHGVKGWEFEFVRFYRNTYAANPAVYLLNEPLGGGTFRNTQNITFDRCLIDGGTNGAWANALYIHGANYVVDRCYIHNIRFAGRESHAIVSHDGPGPYTITDNYLEAASINCLFGGWTSSSSAHTPNNILFENNTCFKRLSFQGGGFAVKNLFELKHATNVTVRGNTFTNNWTDGQDGHGILFQATNDAGDSPWTKIEDVLFELNSVRNIERGINLNGYDAYWGGGHESSGMRRITFRNNFFQINTARILTVVNEVDDLTIEHNTFDNVDDQGGGKIGIMIYGLIAIPGGPPHTRPGNYAIKNFIFRNNLLKHGGGWEGEYGLMGTAGLNEHVDGTYDFSYNVMAGGPDGITYPTATNQFPTVATYNTNFVDLVDYVLTGGSAYNNAGSDGFDLGKLDTSPLNITTVGLPNGTVGTAYSQTINVVGGTPPYTTAISSGALPAGLTFTGATRVIAGTPTTAESQTFTVQVIDDVAAIDFQAMTLTINAAAGGPTITTTTLPDATILQNYSATISVSGGTAPYTSSIVSGALPAGLTYTGATRTISGTPTTAESQTFTVRVTDANTLYDDQVLTLDVNLALPPGVFSVLTVDNIYVPMRAGSLRMTSTVNGRGTFECEALSLDGLWRPALGEEVSLVDNGIRIFGGYIDQPSENGVKPQGGIATAHHVRAIDFNAYADRKFISASLAAGTLKAALTVIVGQLQNLGVGQYGTPLGVTLHPDQVDGPTLPAIVWDYRKARDVLDELSALTDWTYVWRIDHDAILRMVLIGTEPAAFSIVPSADGNAIGDITVATSRTELANRIFFKAGTGTREVWDTFVGDSSNRVFPLRVPMATFPSVYVNGSYRHTGRWGDDLLFEWTYRESDNMVVQLADAPPGISNAALTSGDDLLVKYIGQYPIRLQAEDVDSQAANGLYEMEIVDSDVFDPTVAQQLADGYLEQFKGHEIKTVKYTTTRLVSPGQSQTIIVPERDISGTFLVTDVETYDSVNILFRNVTAVSGGHYYGSWRDLYRRGFSGAGAISGSGGGGGAGGAPVGSAISVQTGGFFDGSVDAPEGYYAYGRQVKESHPNYVPHNDANFLGDGVSADWVVDISDQVGYTTTADGKFMTASFAIVESRTPNAGVTQLQIVVPGTIVGYHYAVGVAVDNNAAHTATIPILISAENGNQYIGINKIPVTDWSVVAPAPGNTTSLTRVFGQITFEIT